MKIKSKKNYVLILASGGMDSTASIRFYKKLKFEIELLFVDYGQASANLELKALKKISKHYSSKVIKVIVKNNKNFKDGMIQGRNAFLFFTALLNFRKKNGTIACGLHAGTNYYDCSEEFVNIIQDLFDKYSQGTIKIGVPFLNFDKKEIFMFCRNENVPIELTYSCELGKLKPCGRCNTCKDLNAIYASQK